MPEGTTPLPHKGRELALIEAALIEMQTAELIPHDQAMDELDAAIEEAIAEREP